MKFKAEKEDEKRLDHLLSTKFVQHSRSFIQRIIKEGKVLVDDKLRSPGYVIRQNQVVTVAEAEEETSGKKKRKQEVKIIHEDDQILVIEKPAGIVVYDIKKKEDSILEKLKAKIKIKDGERQGIVHRLDRDTSGLMVVARTLEAEENLIEQFKERTVEKGYIALVYGHVEPKKGEINIPIERAESDRTKKAVGSEGKNAVTKYEVLEYLGHDGEDYTLLDLHILTGRTHQIRVHMESIGFPLVGDKTYTNKLYLKKNKELGFTRQFLHAYILGFNHPKTGEWVGYRNDLPLDLAKVLDDLRE